MMLHSSPPFYNPGSLYSHREGKSNPDFSKPQPLGPPTKGHCGLGGGHREEEIRNTKHEIRNPQDGWRHKSEIQMLEWAKRKGIADCADLTDFGHEDSKPPGPRAGTRRVQVLVRHGSIRPFDRAQGGQAQDRFTLIDTGLELSALVSIFHLDFPVFWWYV
jgi:hypothetical protein